MSTLSVPLTTELANKIDGLVAQGIARNKAEFARQALEKFIEDQAVEAVLRSQREFREGKILRGDLDELAKKL